MTRWSWFYLGLGGYLVALLGTAPATLIGLALERASGGKFGIADAQGTIWAGTGQVEIYDADRRARFARPLEWHVEPGSLLLGKVEWKARLGNTLSPLLVTVSTSRIEIDDARIELPAVFMSVVEPRLAPLDLRGTLLLRIAHLSVEERDRINGEFTVQWTGASSGLVPNESLGAYELRGKIENTVGHLELHTMQGPLALDGKGLWYGDKPAEFHATARVAEDRQKQLTPLLRLIGIEGTGGRFDLQLK